MLTTDVDSVIDAFIQFYQGLFGTATEHITPLDTEVVARGRILTNDEADAMCRLFSVADVREAIFSIPNDKAPGPDGFSMGFYKSAWSIVGEDVTKVVLNFFHSGKILGKINATNIALVPKTKCPQQVADYRLISCCNVIYKVISKLVSKRLNEVLHLLVSDAQTAYVSGRSIISNVLLCQDLVRNYQRKIGSPRCLMKIDLRKAYDMVHWQFIVDVLIAMNFPAKFVNWIATCLRTAKFSILLSSYPCGFFNGKRGLRQGDPISPYLFLLLWKFYLGSFSS